MSPDKVQNEKPAQSGDSTHHAGADTTTREAASRAADAFSREATHETRGGDHSLPKSGIHDSSAGHLPDLALTFPDKSNDGKNSKDGHETLSNLQNTSHFNFGDGAKAVESGKFGPTKVRDNNGTESAITYDAEGRPTAINSVNPKDSTHNQTTKIDYDKNNTTVTRQEKSTDRPGQITTTTEKYGPDGMISTVIKDGDYQSQDERSYKNGHLATKHLTESEKGKLVSEAKIAYDSKGKPEASKITQHSDNGGSRTTWAIPTNDQGSMNVLTTSTDRGGNVSIESSSLVNDVNARLDASGKNGQPAMKHETESENGKLVSEAKIAYDSKGKSEASKITRYFDNGGSRTTWATPINDQGSMNVLTTSTDRGGNVSIESSSLVNDVNARLNAS